MEQLEILNLAMLGILKQMDNIAELVKMGKEDALKEQEALEGELLELGKLVYLEQSRD